MVKMTMGLLKEESMEQYQKEERSLLAKRASSEKKRLNALLRCMKNDTLSLPEKITELKMALYVLTKDVKFKKAKNMGEVLSAALDFIKRNYESENPYLIR